MSMLTNVVGIVPPDDKWQKMKQIWDTCMEAHFPVPKEVEKFFNHEPPDDDGVVVMIPAEKWSDECRDGFQIELSKIPQHVKFIRFYNSY